MDEKVYGSLSENRKACERLFGISKSFDLISRDMTIGARDCCFYFVDGLIKDEVMQKLMDALGMTMDDFIRLVDNKERSTDEDILISVFHSMNPDGRARALQLLQDMADSGHYPIRLIGKDEE